jgi:hypothetical protein
MLMSENPNESPAPNAYKVDEVFGKNKVSCTISGRHETKTYVTRVQNIYQWLIMDHLQSILLAPNKKLNWK